MNTYVNHIYLTICEVTLKTYRGTNYQTYLAYCKGMLNTLGSDTISTRDKRDLLAIYEFLEPIFSLNINETGKHIVDYFALTDERLLAFEKAVRSTTDVYKFIGFDHKLVL